MANQPLTRAEARSRSSLLAVLGYTVRLQLHESDGYESTTQIRFTCNQPGASSFVDVESDALAGAELNGETLRPDRFNGSRLLLDGLSADNELSVTMRCSYDRSGVGLRRVVDPSDGLAYVYSHFQPFNAHRVFACFDQPDLKAPYRLHIHAPASWRVIASAVLTGRDSGGGLSFATTPPLPTYAVGLAAGPWHTLEHRHGNIVLGISCRQSMAQHLDAMEREIVAVTVAGLDFFESLFEHPYAFAKYDQLFVPDFPFGAMENVACVTLSDDMLDGPITRATRDELAMTVLHELAHMWFGNLVTVGWWDDLWLSEGLACHLAASAHGRTAGDRSSWQGRSLRRSAAIAQDQLSSAHPVAADIVDTDAIRTSFDAIAYGKGEAVLRQLATWLGKPALAAALRSLVGAHRFANAGSAELLAALSTASGQDLRAWAAAWLETSGVSTLSPLVSADGDRYTGFSIVQEPPAPSALSRSHRMGIGLYSLVDDRLERLHRIEAVVSGPVTDIDALVGTPVADLIVVDEDRVTFAKTPLDPRSLSTVRDRISQLQSARIRWICWDAAWEMTRDAQLPARQWVAMVLAHAPAEIDALLLRNLLTQTRLAIDLYAHAEARHDLLAGLCATARQALQIAAPNSDLQSEWFRCLLAGADAPDDTEFVKRCLAGTASIPCPALRGGLRWDTITALASAGTIGATLVDSELASNPSATGGRRAATARAALRTPAAKEATWTRLVHDRSLSIATVEALLAGFQRPGHDALLVPYVDRYVDVLPSIWTHRGPDQALMLTRGLYPAHVVSDAVVAAADRALTLNLPASAHRLIEEERDHTLRALRARAADAPALVP